MKKVALYGLGIALCLSLTTPSVYARYDEHDAKRDCERAMSRDNRFKGMRDVRVKERRNHSYRVRGTARMKGNDTGFECRIRDKQVIDWYFRDGYYDRREGHNRHDRYERRDRW